MPPRPKLRLISESDYPFLQRLYASTRTAEMNQVVHWTAAQKEAFLTMQWQAQLNHYQEQFPHATHHLILPSTEHNQDTPDTPIGRLYVDRRPDEIRLLDITLLPEWCGQGLGTALIQALLDEAAQKQQPVRLYVWQGNEAAHRLYQRLGFQDKEAFEIYIFMEWCPPIP